MCRPRQAIGGEARVLLWGRCADGRGLLLLDAAGIASAARLPTMIDDRTLRQSEQETKAQAGIEMIAGLFSVISGAALPMTSTQMALEMTVSTTATVRPTQPPIIAPRVVIFDQNTDMISTGMVESPASTFDDIIAEVAAARVTERGSRADDKASEAAMEDRKKAGYF